ncbi:MAG: MBL fold metallo-hydrolase [Immundisolibacteraceae bacterium]|nr:MBL fold metallo-hydrolase [Immundisolibacteraceae bacterium]
MAVIQTIISVLTICLFTSSLRAGEMPEWPAFEGVELKTVPVAGNVFMIQSPSLGGNVGVFVGAEGVLVVDSMFPALGDRLLAEIRKTTDAEVKYLVNTHIHPDHTSGNGVLASEDVLILAHDNIRTRALQKYRWPRNGGSFAPKPAEAARPFLTFSDAISFHFNGEEVRAFIVPAAHTDGDTFVHFTQSDVLHLGDVFRTTSYPVIDVYNGGSLAGTIQALGIAIEMAGPNTRIIPGHGVIVVSPEALIEFRSMIEDVRDRVHDMINKGMNLSEIMSQQPTAKHDARWGQDPGWNANHFVPVVYHELGGSD